MSDYRQSSCSAVSQNILWFNGCSQQGSKGYRYHTAHNVTSPVPLPKGGNGDGTGTCDCTELFETSVAGSNWDSSFQYKEQWQGSPVDMLTVQTFATGSDYVIPDCQKVMGGFKNVAAKRQWHGRFGFTDLTSCGSPSSSATQAKYTGFNYSINASSGMEITHKLVRNSGSTVLFSYTDTLSGNESVNYSCTVNTATGILTVSDSESFGGFIDHFVDNLTPSYNYDITSSNVLFFPFSALFPPISLVWRDFNAACGNILFWAEHIPITSALGGTAADIASHFNVGYAGQGVTIAANCSLSNDSFFLEILATGATVSYADVDSLGYPCTRTYIAEGESKVSITASLSGANYASDMLADAETMLSNWDLTNNQIYPWRSDNWTSYMPLVQKREVQYNVVPVIAPKDTDDFRAPIYSGSSIIGYTKMAWFDPNDKWWKWVVGHENEIASSLESTHMDGTVLGKPYTPTISGTASIAYGWFDFYGDYIKYCPQPTGIGCVGPNWEQWTWQHGGTLADMNISNSGTEDGGQLANILPMCSTHWVNNEQAHSLAKGALRKSSIGDDAIWAVKWASSRQPVQSQNYFRPCGADRVLIDETTARNISISEGDLVMESELIGLTGGSQVLVFNGTSNGIYTGCSQDTYGGGGEYLLTTGTKIADLPTDFTRPLEGYVIGFVRFPSAWPICGREQVTITGSATASVVTFVNAQTNLRTGDKLNFYDRTFSSSLVSQSVTRTDDSHFTIATAYSGSLTGSIYVTSTGAPDYHWNDTTPKFEFRYNFWNTNNRLGTVASDGCLTECVPYTPCDLQVVCFSPNSESFANGKTMWFATSSFAADDYYGSMQQSHAEFEITDPLFQTPLAPIVSDLFDDPAYATILPEDGSCPDNTFNAETGAPILFYHVPKVEARCDVPSGAPSLPSGIVYPTIPQPPLAGVVGYSFHTYLEPWNYYANALAHCDGCRFDYSYKCYGV